MDNIVVFLQNFINKKDITYQKLTQACARMDDVNSYILNDYNNKISVTLVDKINNPIDSNIYFDYIKSSINSVNMYQIHFNAELINKSKLSIILSEIFVNKNTDIKYLETLTKPLF